MNTTPCHTCTNPEHWKPIPHYTGIYDASDHGRIWSRPRLVPSKGNSYRRAGGVLLTPTLTKDRGYFVVNLSDGKTVMYYVHFLVLTTFVGPPPEGTECCHWDSDRTNNHIPNLRWDTPTENSYDTVRNGNHRGVNKENCPRDHPLALPNLVISKLPHRTCLACARTRASQHHAKKKGRPFDFRAEADHHYAKIMVGI